MQTEYNHQEIEQKVQQYWRDNQTFKVTEDAKQRKVLLSVNAAVSKWSFAHGSRAQLHHW